MARYEENVSYISI